MALLPGSRFRAASSNTDVPRYDDGGVLDPALHTPEQVATKKLRAVCTVLTIEVVMSFAASKHYRPGSTP